MRTVFPAQILRTSFAFGLAQFVMPVLGWLAGRTIVNIISSYDHWVAFGLLVLVGGRMLWESFHSDKESSSTTDISRGLTLFTLTIATSIDSLAVGLSFALLNVNIYMASLAIGVVAFLITAAGFLLSRQASLLLGKRARLIGGLILIGIGIRILLEHIL